MGKTSVYLLTQRRASWKRPPDNVHTFKAAGYQCVACRVGANKRCEVSVSPLLVPTNIEHMDVISGSHYIPFFGQTKRTGLVSCCVFVGRLKTQV